MFETTPEKFIDGLIERVNVQIDRIATIRRGYNGRRVPATAKDRYPHRRRLALTGLAFGLVFHAARQFRSLEHVHAACAYAAWSNLLYEKLLSKLQFSEVQECFAMHRKRAEWDRLLCLAVENAVCGANAEFDMATGRPRASWWAMDSEAFIAALRSHHPSGGEDPYAFWHLPFLPERLHYAQPEPVAARRKDEDVVGYAIREAFQRGIK